MPRRPPRPVPGRDAWERLPAASRDAQHRAMRAVGYMRTDGLSLTDAARLAGTTPATVRRYAGPALSGDGRGYRAAAHDDLYRRMAVQGFDGRVDVDVHGSRDASLVGAHHNVIGRYLATGDPRVLDPFRGRRVGDVELLTDIDRIEELAAARDLDIDDIYPHT